MNDNLQLLGQAFLIAAGPFLAARGVTLSLTDLHTLAGAGLLLAGIIWKFIHWHATPSAQPVPITKGNGMAPNIPLMVALLALPLLFAGCTSGPVVGHVYSVTDTGFGLDVQTTSNPNQTPRVRLGFLRSVVFVEPVVTNTPLSVPDVANNFGLNNSAGSGVSLDISESVASGRYQTGSGTNPISSQPIIPK